MLLVADIFPISIAQIVRHSKATLHRCARERAEVKPFFLDPEPQTDELRLDRLHGSPGSEKEDKQARFHSGVICCAGGERSRYRGMNRGSAYVDATARQVTQIERMREGDKQGAAVSKPPN
jgi:hypothetical protein